MNHELLLSKLANLGLSSPTVSWFMIKSCLSGRSSHTSLVAQIIPLCSLSHILLSFDYCEVVWSGCSKSDALHLETLLNFACRTVLRSHRDFLLLLLVVNLAFPLYSTRRKLHTAQAMFKCLSSLSLSYLSQLFSFPTSCYNMHSSSTCQFSLPSTRTCFGQKAFSFAGASLWLTLLENIRTCSNFGAFLASCKAFLRSKEHS